MVYHETQNEKVWLGPVKVTNVQGNYIYVTDNEDTIKNLDEM